MKGAMTNKRKKLLYCVCVLALLILLGIILLFAHWREIVRKEEIEGYKLNEYENWDKMTMLSIRRRGSKLMLFLF